MNELSLKSKNQKENLKNKKCFFWRYGVGRMAKMSFER
jgi:hypothetical protein